MAQPEGQDHPPELDALVEEHAQVILAEWVKILKAQGWTPHEIFDKFQGIVKGAQPSDPST